MFNINRVLGAEPPITFFIAGTLFFPPNRQQAGHGD
jgi:hypothetical protein